MMANVGNPAIALLVNRWLVGTAGLQVVIAHEIHVVLIRFLLCRFSNGQQQKNYDRKVSFHMNTPSLLGCTLSRLRFTIILKTVLTLALRATMFFSRFASIITSNAFVQLTIAVHSSSMVKPISKIRIRRATVEDAEVCSRICYDAFTTINRQHNFPPKLPAPEASIDVLRMLFSHPKYYCVVAELNGRIVESNCLDERSTIAA